MWIHAPSASAAGGLLELSRRLIEEEIASVLFTSEEVIPSRASLVADRPPLDTSRDVIEFLDHWKPDQAIFSDGEIRPALVHELGERGIPVMMVDAREPHLLRERDGWFPGLLRSSLQVFNRILALDDASARAFRRAGASQTAVQVVGRLETESAVLPCLEAERAALAKLLATRPVWLAAGLPEAEETAIVAAHRAALGLSHRLLLIVAPQDSDRAAALAEKLASEQGWVVAQRALDEEPEPDVEVFIADGTVELGLWYRLAPITFLGGSLAGKGCQRNPMEPAALGSAILYGPRPGNFSGEFGRLGSARAARAVGDARDLSEALADLMAPDKVARLAQAAWTVTSEGVEVTEHAIRTVRELLEGTVA